MHPLEATPETWKWPFPEHRTAEATNG